MKKTLLVLMVIAVYVLHQDFWNWKRSAPLIFGVLPIGLAYHAAYSILASIMMATLVKFAWPKHLEMTESDGKITPAAAAAKGPNKGGHA